MSLKTQEGRNGEGYSNGGLNQSYSECGPLSSSIS